jgi:hypothetical protein
MEGDLKRLGQFHQFACPTGVGAAVGIEDAECNSVSAKLLGEQDVAAHDIELVVGVTEVSGTGANQDPQLEGNSLTHHGNQASARSDSPFCEIAAQFDSMGTALLGGNCRRN